MPQIASNSIVKRPIDELRLPDNPLKTYNRHQRRALKKIGIQFNTIPIVVDGIGRVVANAAWYLAAKEAGVKEVLTVDVSHLSAEQLSALQIADGRIGELGAWNKDVLNKELKRLRDMFPGFDIEATGFTIEEVEIKTNALTFGSSEPPIDVLDQRRAVSKSEDCWALGPHRLLCRSTIDPATLPLLMSDQVADVVFTDPPYNVPIEGHARGNGALHYREFEMASGELNETEFVEFLRSAFHNMQPFLRDGALLYSFIDWRGAWQIKQATKDLYSQLNLCVWVKPNGGMGSLYRSRHELVFVLKNGSSRHCNNIQLGRHGRNRTNVWEYEAPALRSNKQDDDLLADEHPTVKPLGLICDALLDSTKRGEIVLDPFLGSGQTLLAAEKTGRVCRGVEIDPHYVDLCVRRWQLMTGENAIHQASGKSFDERSGCLGGDHVE